MAWLRIPPQHVTGLKELLALKDRRVNDLAAALKKTPPTLNEDDFLRFVGDKLGKGRQVAPEIITLLLSLNVLRLRLDLDTSRLVELVCEAMNEGEYEELRISEENRNSFAQRLTKLLGMESLLYPAKGPSVIQAHEYLFAHARIITDIRPIFGADITIQPSAAAIIHTLQVTSYHGDNVKDFYLAMDRTDVELLGDVLKRAARKADNLRSVLKKTGMTTIWE